MATSDSTVQSGSLVHQLASSRVRAGVSALLQGERVEGWSGQDRGRADGIERGCSR